MHALLARSKSLPLARLLLPPAAMPLEAFVTFSRGCSGVRNGALRALSRRI